LDAEDHPRSHEDDYHQSCDVSQSALPLVVVGLSSSRRSPMRQ
jgi:hypothetical protein